RFELSKVTVPAIRERMVASLLNASPELAARLAQDLGMELPVALPKALESPATPEIENSPPLSLMARPGDGGIRTRKVAILVAHGVEGASLGKLVSALVAAGAVPRLVAARLGTYIGVGGEKFAADATMENSPGFLFDALVLPDGAGAVEALAEDAHTLEFLRAQYWHCKTILTFGASQALLSEAQIPMTFPDGSPDTGLILADAQAADAAIADFIAGMGLHRHYDRENDPPKV
ncbi:MAG: Catalase, partial [Chitinophagaceae bacterium]|nr:Catalase [Chitinophagaceae bacterium]